MDAGKMKSLAPWLVVSVLSGVVIWIMTPRHSATGSGKAPVPVAVNDAPVPHAPPGSVLVNINMVGFDPAEIEAKAGQPIKLAFFRPNDANCAREVVFPDLGIRKTLPAGETTVVELTPPKTGSLGFACGMDMLKGKLIVR